MQFGGVTIGGLAFFLIGLIDDLFGLSAISRLIVQAIVASMAWKVGVAIHFLTLPMLGITILPDWMSLIVTIFWLVGMANAINWIDGLDGLAAGVSGIAAMLMLVVSLYMAQPAAALIAAALAGGAIAFLKYNFNPAQIFMGDGGCLFYWLYAGRRWCYWLGKERNDRRGTAAFAHFGCPHFGYVYCDFAALAPGAVPFCGRQASFTSPIAECRIFSSFYRSVHLRTRALGG